MRPVIVMVIMCLASRAVADPCKGAEPKLRKIATELQKLSRDSGDAFVTCTFHGPDEKLAAKLRALGAKITKDEQAIAGYERCTVNPAGHTPVSFVNVLDQWTADRFNLAIDKCSAKAENKAATGDDCASVEEWSRSYFDGMEDTAAKMIDLAVTCGFKGASDKGMANIGKVTRPKLKRITDKLPKNPACKVDNFQKQLESQSESAGKRIGYTVAICSATARAKEAEFAKAGKTDANELQKELEPTLDVVFKQVFPF